MKNPKRKFHGKTENMGRPRVLDETVIKAVRLEPEMVERVESIGKGNFTLGLRSILEKYFRP